MPTWLPMQVQCSVRAPPVCLAEGTGVCGALAITLGLPGSLMSLETEHLSHSCPKPDLTAHLL